MGKKYSPQGDDIRVLAVRESYALFLYKEATINIYVGNLSAEVTGEDLRREFTAFGEVISVTVVRDKAVGDFKGYGFVEMHSSSEGEAAIAAMNRVMLSGRKISVIEALPLSRKADSAPYAGSYGDRPRHRRSARN